MFVFFFLLVFALPQLASPFQACFDIDVGDPNAVPLSKCYTDLSLVSSPIPFMLKVIEVYPLCKPDAMMYVEDKRENLRVQR